MRERVRRVLGYVRVSGQEQGRTGTSLDAQREEIERYCAAHGYPKPAIHVEVESAGAEKLERRAVLRSLLASVEDGDLVIVSKQDRWSRDTLFYLSSTRDLVARGARFFSIAERFDPETPEGRFAATIMAAVAEQERERIRERTVVRRKAMRDEGRYVEGLPPIGYRRGKGNILEPVDSDVAIVRDVYARCVRGESISTVKEHLETEFPDRHGWDKKTIGKMLRSRVYLGEVTTSAGAWVKSHAPIVERDIWERAQTALASRRLGGRRSREDARTAAWLLRGLAVCARCGSKMGAAYSRGARGSVVEYYACYARLRGTCDAPYARVEVADRDAAPLIEAHLVELCAELGRSKAAPVQRTSPAAARAKLEARRERTISIAADGHISREQLAERLARIDVELGRIEVAAADERRAATVARPEVRRELLGEVKELRKAWRRAVVGVRREILKRLALRVELDGHEEPRPIWRSLADLVA